MVIFQLQTISRFILIFLKSRQQLDQLFGIAAAKGIPFFHARFGMKVSIYDDEKYKQAQCKSLCATPAINPVSNVYHAVITESAQVTS